MESAAKGDERTSRAGAPVRDIVGGINRVADIMGRDRRGQPKLYAHNDTG
ncbi:hypothetical protein ACTPOE_16290 [Castellaniella sp. WN]